MVKRAANDGSTNFSGLVGKRRLLEAIKSQTLVSGNAELARAVIKCGVLQQHEVEDVLMQQGEPENDLLLIITGEVSIRVNERRVAFRSAGTHVGEMALVDPLAKRSATVVAAEPSVTLRVPEYRFSKLATRHPELWRRVAVELAKRLRERNKALRPPHNEPVLFVGSSSEGLTITNEVYRRLVHKPIVVRPWSEGVFQASSTSIESLVSTAQEADFAALVLTADDMIVSRGKAKPSPRDNVIFELGLFMGTLGRERVFILKPKGTDIRIPSDLLGVTWLEYHKTGPIRLRLRLACERILKAVTALGPR
jgi:CRP/FNR family cyclic AMP-dependent transcriptional regulator